MEAAGIYSKQGFVHPCLALVAVSPLLSTCRRLLSDALMRCLQSVRDMNVMDEYSHWMLMILVCVL